MGGRAGRNHHVTDSIYFGHHKTARMSEAWNKFSVQIGVDRQLGAKLKVAPDENDSGIAVVEHTLPPWKLGAPLHRHTHEDEISYVLEGVMAAQEGEEVTRVEAGEFIVKNRDIWHTFWNPGPEQLRFLEIIAPGEFARYFEKIAEIPPDDGSRDEAVINQIEDLGQEYGFESDASTVPDLIDQHGLDA